MVTFIIHPLHLSVNRYSPCTDNETLLRRSKNETFPLCTEFPLIWDSFKDNGVMPGIPGKCLPFPSLFMSRVVLHSISLQN